jgi:hypothetical protein
MAAVYSQMYYGSEDNFPEVKWPVEPINKPSNKNSQQNSQQ